MNRYYRILVCGAMLGALVGCEDEPTRGERPAPLCGRNITVTVGAGLTPTFSWSPHCRVTRLDVIDTSTDESVWSLLALSLALRTIVPPITYGVVPEDVIELTVDSPAQLEAGASYLLVLTVADILAGNYEAARLEFTR